MPNEFQCESCNLALMLGWYHFHRSADGYWSATFCYCERCGTIHRLDHAKQAALPDRLYAQPEPIYLDAKRKPSPIFNIPLKDWLQLGEARRCGHCGAENALHLADLDQALTVEQCPRCGSNRVKTLAGWIT